MIAVPDFYTLLRRGNGLALRTKPRVPSQAGINVVVDSTGLKIFGEGDWLEDKHMAKRRRRSWRKLHLGFDLVSGDPTAISVLLDQFDCPVSHFLADGAYDGEPTSDLLAARFGSMIEVTTPPRKTAILSANAGKEPTARDCHIADIATRGRMAWQKSTGYNQRSRGETQIGRWKIVIGPKLKTRAFKNQKSEAKIGVQVLNRMTRLGRPLFERTA